MTVLIVDHRVVTAGVHQVTSKHVSSVTCAACAACAAPMAGPSHAALGGEVSCPPGRHITHQHQPAAIAGLHWISRYLQAHSSIFSVTTASLSRLLL